MAEVMPLYYVRGDEIFQRPVRTSRNHISTGFRVCFVSDGVDPNDVCAILNKGEKPDPNEPVDE